MRRVIKENRSNTVTVELLKITHTKEKHAQLYYAVISTVHCNNNKKNISKRKMVVTVQHNETQLLKY